MKWRLRNVCSTISRAPETMQLVNERSRKNTAECILAEAKAGGYQTRVMGRCGVPPTVHALMGSIANKIINRGAGIAVCLVG